MSAREFLAGMSEEQREAALTTDDPVMIIAGAGSGKTRTLVGRFIHIVTPPEEGGLGADPSSVMMVTFTNKAAREMRERILPVLQDLRAADPNGFYGEPWIGTFHGISLRILRLESERAGLAKNFSIFDEADARSLAEDVAESLNRTSFDVDEFFRDLELAKSRMLSDRLLMEKSLEISMKDMTGAAMTRQDAAWTKILDKFVTPDFVTVYAAYQRALKDQNAVDFSDLLNTVTEIFRDNPMIRDSWRSTFRHFMIDEVQDINRAQATWMDMFTDGCRPMILDQSVENNATVSAADGLHQINGYRVRSFPRPTMAFVGDDDQSIYAFRGSDVHLMHDLRRRYDGLQLCYLKTSYRCQPSILSAANTLVEVNTGRFDKTLEPADMARAKSPVLLERHQTPYDEIRSICAEAQRYMANQGDPSEYAILVRTRDLVKAVAKEMRASGLPVVEGKASDIRKSAEVRDAMAFAGFLVNPDAETFLRRIINKPSRGMGPTSINRVMRNARMKNCSFTDELRSVMNDRVDLPPDAEPYGKAFIQSAKDFGRLIVELRGGVQAAPDASAALLSILERTGYLGDLKRSALRAAGISAEPDLMALPPREFLVSVINLYSRSASSGKKKDEDLGIDDLSGEDLADRAGAMSETARRIGNLSLLLDQASGFESLDAFLQESTLEMDQAETQSGFRVMTIHASKGLEFDRVRLPFWVEGVMPHARGTSGSEDDLEEERRLAYVALTRARETVRVTTSSDVSSFPQIRMRYGEQSRFIREIERAPRGDWAFQFIRASGHPCYDPKGAFDDRKPVFGKNDGFRKPVRPQLPTPVPAGRDDDLEFARRLLGARAPAAETDVTPEP